MASTGKQLAAALVAVVTLGIGPSARGQEPPTDGVRRDPKGQKGISPYQEALAQGRKASAEKNHDGAISAFQAAIKLDEEQQYAYLLLAQAQLAKGSLDEARATLLGAEKRKGDERVNASYLFLRADVLERGSAVAPAEGDGSALAEALASRWAQIKEAWSAYSVFLAAHPTVAGYKATSDERQKQADARAAREKEYEPVRKRLDVTE